MKVDKDFSGTVLYFKEKPGAGWKQLLALPDGTENVEAEIENKQNEFLSAYPYAEFKTEVK